MRSVIVAMRARGIVCLALSLSLVFGGGAIAATRADLIRVSVEMSQQRLDSFYSSHSLDDLQAAIAPLAHSVDIGAIDPRDYVSRRRTVLAGWAHVFHAIEITYDPPSYPKVDLSCPAPGRESSGRQLFSCVDPKYIQDAAVRTAYIAALDEYKLKVKHANYQARLHTLDDDGMFVLQGELSSFHVVAPSDTAALESILQQAGLSTARQQVIVTMIQGRQVR